MTNTPRHLALTITAVSVALVVLAGCSGTTGDGPAQSPTQLAPAQQWDPDDVTTSTEPTAPTAATTLPDSAATVDRTDPNDVAQTAVQIWFTWDTATDTGPNDAAARTAPLLTEAFARSLLSTGSNNPGGQWITWAEHDATITPTLTAMPDQGAPQSAERKYFLYEVTQTARTPSGEKVGATVTTSAWVICVLSADGWEVSQLAQR